MNEPIVRLVIPSVISACLLLVATKTTQANSGLLQFCRQPVAPTTWHRMCANMVGFN